MKKRGDEEGKRAVVLLSGGIDSTTTLAIAKAGGYEIYALSFNYEQRHKIELESAGRVADKLGVAKHLIIHFNLREIGGSALTTEMKVPKKSGKVGKRGAEENNAIPVTYVPARNTIFLSFALGWAEALGVADIFIGANAVDYSGYPDCRPEFITAFEDMANLATKASVQGKCRFKIHAPLIHLTKGEIIKRGVELGVDYSLTWSCYDPQEIREEAGRHGRGKGRKSLRTSSTTHFLAQFVPCMRCDSCFLRAKGFREAGIKDPLHGSLQ